MQQYGWAETLAASQRVNWKIEDVIGEGKHLDFTKPFLPESLARVEPLHFLDEAERLALNHVRGHGYLRTFGLVEEFILPFVLDHARPRLHGDGTEVRALLQFASEEAKHVELFRRFAAEFEAGFGTRCGFIGPAEDIASHVLSHHPLAVALTILHVEWMTQGHYLESVRDRRDLDPQFESLLRHHWMEEAQHAKLDTLVVAALAGSCTEREIDDAVESYLEIGGFLDRGLEQQVALDLESLERATGRVLRSSERRRFVEVQHQALRWTFLGSGMTHRRFLATLERLQPRARTRVEQVAPAFCWSE